MELVVSSAGPEPASVAGLADALRAFERRIEAERPGLVRLEDDSDASLAAALVAVKLLIPLEASPAASDPATTNGRLIAQIAAT